MGAITAAVAEGSITPGEGEAIEATDFDRRLTLLEGGGDAGDC